MASRVCTMSLVCEPLGVTLRCWNMYFVTLVVILDLIRDREPDQFPRLDCRRPFRRA